MKVHNIATIMQQQASSPFAKASVASAKPQVSDKVKINGNEKDRNQKKSFFSQLIERRQEVMEQKNSLIAKTLEKGGSLKDIKDQLKSYEEQLKNLDQQMAEELRKQQEKAQEAKEKESKDAPKEMTKEEVQMAHIQNIISIEQEQEKIAVYVETQGKMEARAGVLKAEIAMDESSSVTGQLASDKRETVAHLEERIANAQAEIGNSMKNMREISKSSSMLPPVENTSDAKEEQAAEHILKEEEANKQEEA